MKLCIYTYNCTYVSLFPKKMEMTMQEQIIFADLYLRFFPPVITVFYDTFKLMISPVVFSLCLDMSNLYFEKRIICWTSSMEVKMLQTHFCWVQCSYFWNSDIFDLGPRPTLRNKISCGYVCVCRCNAEHCMTLVLISCQASWRRLWGVLLIINR